MKHPATLKDACAIVGIGNTAYTRGTERSVLELHLEASLKALGDAGLTPTDVDGVIPSSSAERVVEEFTRNLGIRELAISSTPYGGGSSFGMALQEACMAIHAGVATCVLIPAGRNGYSSSQRISRQTDRPDPAMAHMSEFELPLGNIGPAQWFAQAAQRHMYEYGTTSEQLGTLAVTIRRHANLNPQAFMFDRTLSLEQHQASPIIVDPFHLFDCSLETDGAGAIVVVDAERARDLSQLPIYISGIGVSFAYPGTSITQKDDMALIDGISVAGRRAYTMAGLTPDDIDCAQIHEGFSWFAVACLEALGFCKVGEGGPFVEDGNIDLGGLLPLNTHGGSLSEAHVSGANHVIEAVRQLRRSVEPERQVANCERVLVANEGNFGNGAVMILRR
jgi:acetyl-CoA acetyltransferase